MINAKQLAKLAKLAFDEKELEQITEDMVSIVELMDTLKDVNIADDNFAEEAVSLEDLRADEVRKSLNTDVLLSQCPSEDKSAFAIPRVVE